MTIRLRTAFFILVGILFVWFIYVQREILTPFVLAAIFAYICNPVVTFLSENIKLPRTISVIIIYVLLLTTVVSSSIILTRRAVDESYQFNQYFNSLISSAGQGINNLPDWLRPTALDAISSLDRSKLFSFSPSLLSLFPSAISRIVSFVIFLFSGFYFLKEGKNIFDKILNYVPNDYKIEVDILFRKINSVLGAYLRGQVFLVVFMSSLFFIALSLFNIKFALIVAIFAGVAEIVPIIGPIIATTVAGSTAYITGSSGFGMSSIQTALFVFGIFIALRQLEDYAVAPYIMGKITKLHPLIILFAVVAGGNTWGILGLMLAIPTAATIKIIMGFLVDKINYSERRTARKV